MMPLHSFNFLSMTQWQLLHPYFWFFLCHVSSLITNRQNKLFIFVCILTNSMSYIIFPISFITTPIRPFTAVFTISLALIVKTATIFSLVKDTLLIEDPHLICIKIWNLKQTWVLDTHALHQFLVCLIDSVYIVFPR